VVIFAGSPAATIASGGADAAPPMRATWTIRTMGTYGRVTIVTPDSAAAAATALAALGGFARVDSLMSNWTTTSEVARINRVAGAGTTSVHPEVATVIDASLRTWRESHGAFDITVEPLIRLWGFIGGPRRVPADDEIAATLRRVGAQQVRFDPRARTIAFADSGVRIDLGGIAKGYAVDVAADSLRARGVRDALVDLSGNMVAIGHPPGADHWRIGIRDPRDRMPWFARIAIDHAISTSGQYEQFVAANGHAYGHILDPRTGRPAEGLISVTVLAPTAFQCDAWDTPLFVLGPDAARRAAREHAELSVVLVQPGAGVDTVWVESSLRERFTLEPAAADRFVVRWF
jgi:FAD:protein FMN transferase